MDGWDAAVLARIQFAFTISFHIIFPALSIGLASYLAVLEALWLRTNRDVYLRLFKFWLKIFSLTFGMGVVSGVVMSYQIGTNWSVFADKTGPVLGPLMAYEVLSAFFLEAGFLGVMLFGLKRVGKKLHFFATLMVAIGTLFSAFWILSANSWMHTPAGHAISATGQFVPVDWWAIIFNPSFPYRLVHMVLAAYLTTAFVVGAVGAWHLLRARRNGGDAPGDATRAAEGTEGARTMFSMALWMAAIVAPLQIVAGDLHGLNTLKHQPMKVAAMEGHFETRRGAPLYLFGWPDVTAGKTRYAIAIPKLGSLILTHDLNGKVPGLNDFPRADWPKVAMVFWSFRIMVAIGLLMLLAGVIGFWLRFRRRLFGARLFHRFMVLMGPSGFVAILAGWVTTEVGRQPFTVYGLLRTSESIAPVQAPALAASLLAFVVVYVAVFGVGVYFILQLMRKPVDTIDVEAPEQPLPGHAGDALAKGAATKGLTS